MERPVWEWPHKHRGTSSSQFFLAPSSLTSTSPFTGQSSVYGPQVQTWMAKLNYPTMLAKKWRPLQAFITRLRGINGLVRMIDYQRMYPYYDAFKVKQTEQAWTDGTFFSDGRGWSEGFLPPSVTVDEAALEGATSIVLRGLPANLAAIFAGDLGEVRPAGVAANHGHLYEITTDATTNSDGKVRVYFEPALRKKVAAGDMWVMRCASSVFNLSSDSEGIMARGESGEAAIGISLTEALPWQ